MAERPPLPERPGRRNKKGPHLCAGLFVVGVRADYCFIIMGLDIGIGDIGASVPRDMRSLVPGA